MNKVNIHFDNPTRSAILLTVLAVFIGLLTGIVAAQGKPLFLALLLAPLGVFFLFRFPNLSLVGIFVGVYSLDWLSRVLGILPTQVRWLPEGLIILTIVFILLRVVVDGKSKLRKTPIDLYFVALIIFSLFSAAFNSETIFTTLSGLRNLLRPLLLFYVVVNLGLDRKDIKRLIILLITLEFLQIPIVFYQFLIYGGGDQASGTLGYSASQSTSVLASIFMSLFYGLAIIRKSRSYALSGSFLFLLILFSEGKAGFLVVPLIVLFLLGINFLSAKPEIKAPTLKYAFMIGIMFVIIYRLSMWLAPVVIPRSEIVSFIQHPEKIFEHYEVPLSKSSDIPRSRLGDIQFALILISQEPQYTLLGYGPGAASSSQGLDSGSLYQRYATNPDFLFGNAKAGFTFYASTQISSMLQEFGVIGLILYLLMLLSIFQTVLNSVKYPGTDPFWQGINLGLCGAVFAFTVYSVYYRAWFWEAPAYVFWGLVALGYISGSSPKLPKVTASKEKVGLLND